MNKNNVIKVVPVNDLYWIENDQIECEDDFIIKCYSKNKIISYIICTNLNSFDIENQIELISNSFETYVLLQDGSYREVYENGENIFNSKEVERYFEEEEGTNFDCRNLLSLKK